MAQEKVSNKAIQREVDRLVEEDYKDESKSFDEESYG